MNVVNGQTALWAVLVFALVYLVSPILYWKWLIYQLESGAFPVNADSIGIPFFGFLMLWILGLPGALFTGTVVVSKLRKIHR